MTPVIITKDKFTLDEVLVFALKPFYSEGQGRALCAVCLYHVPENSEVTLPAFFSRSQYIAHFREMHWDHSITTGLHVATQHNTRMYQSMFVYTLCMAHHPVAENPGGAALNEVVLESLNTSNILQRIIPSMRPAPAPQIHLDPAPMAGPSSGLGATRMASPDEIKELENICSDLEKTGEVSKDPRKNKKR
jgi:hypothetical protein